MSLAVIQITFELCAIVTSHDRTVLIIIEILNTIVILDCLILSHVFLSIYFIILLVVTFVLNIVPIVELIINM